MLVNILHLPDFIMVLKLRTLYQNEAKYLICMRNLTKKEQITMEQILVYMARCMFKLFQINWVINTRKRTGE